mgnify:CR=1 FL=1
MIANINKEYSAPSTAKARKQHEELNAQIQAYLNGGGVINEVPDYESKHYKPVAIDQAANKTRKELAEARKKGKEKMSKGEAA